MWVLLRMEPFKPLHSRRQMPLGPYYADFASHGAKLVIEVDGSAHSTDQAIAYDERRSRFIASQGYQVLRFTTLDVLKHLDGVAGAVLVAVTHPPAAPIPPPDEREGAPD